MWGNFTLNKSVGSNYRMLLVFTKLCLYIFVAVHGVRKGSCYFLLPWLAFHVIFIAGLFVAIILIICFALPFIYRLFALIPAFAAILFIFAWSKVILNFCWLNYWHTCAMYAPTCTIQIRPRLVSTYLNSKTWWNHLEKQGEIPSHTPSWAQLH